MFEEISNLEFNQIEFSYHTYYKWFISKTDNELLNKKKKFSKPLQEFNELLNEIDDKILKPFITESDFSDYSITYFYKIKNLKEFFENNKDYILELKEKINNKKIQQEEKQKFELEKIENIKKNHVYFKQKYENGAFTLTHQISKKLFDVIKPFGSYYTKEMLEDFDMFDETAGWSFSRKAVDELSKITTVYINNKKV